MRSKGVKLGVKELINGGNEGVNNEGLTRPPLKTCLRKINSRE